MVSVSSIYHSYHSNKEHRPLLDNISLTINRGETVALIGRSGSGKSTLLNLIGGLEPIQQGEVSIQQTALSPLTDDARTKLRREQIGFVYQSFNLIPTLTVFENISLPMALNGKPRKQIRQQAYAMLDKVALSAHADSFPDTLSGGEQQRVAIARALVHAPKLVLADEPTGNLDAHNGRQIIELLHSAVAQNETTLLLVTHSLEVASVADRTLAMEPDGFTALSREQLRGHVAW